MAGRYKKYKQKKTDPSVGTLSSLTDIRTKRVFLPTRNRFSQLAEEDEQENQEENLNGKSTNPPQVTIYGVTNYRQTLAEFTNHLPMDKIIYRSPYRTNELK